MIRIKFILFIIVTLIFIGCSTEEAIEIKNIKNFPAFVTQDLNGLEVTEKIFANKKITIVNIWTTNSPPSILLLPKLSALSSKFDNLQIIGLVGDVRNYGQSKNLEMAKKIVAEHSDFVNLIVNDDFNDLLTMVTQVPITFFVDNQGQFIGQPVTGDDITLIYNELIRLLDDFSQNDLKFIQNHIFYR